MRLQNETPSEMVQQYYSLPFETYQLELWQNLVLGALIGAAIAFAVTFLILAINQQEQDQ
jgi:uncharacterized membrane protein YccC